MEKTSTLVHNIFTNAKEYISLKTRAVKLDVYDKAASSVSGAVNGAIMAVLGLCAFIFLNVGVAYWLSEVFESTKLGFLTLGGIYVVLLGIFFALKNKIATSVKNSIVVKMSKETITDYEVMMKEKHTVDAQLERAETVVKGNIEELKDNIDTLVEDFKRLKEDVQRFRNIFGHHDNDHHVQKSNFASQDHHHAKSGGGLFPKVAMSTILELLINKFVLKDVISLKKTILPIVAKAFITNKMGQNNGNGSTSQPHGIIETLKAKLSKFL